MSIPDDITFFSAVDRSKEPDFFKRFLDERNKLPGIIARAVRQRKTGRSVRFELTETTRQAVDDYLRAAPKRPGDFLFAGRRPDAA